MSSDVEGKDEGHVTSSGLAVGVHAALVWEASSFLLPVRNSMSTWANSAVLPYCHTAGWLT